MQSRASSTLMPYSNTASLTVSQVFQGVFRRIKPIPSEDSLAQRVLPPAVQAATAELVNVLQAVCAPDSGWPAERPQTPQTLLPYVSDEAEELLEAWHRWQPDVEASSEKPTTPSGASHDTVPELISELGDYLVWSIAASNPDAMTLVGGTSAILQPPCQIKRMQRIRLVPVLNIHFNDFHYAVDLVTRTPFDLADTFPDSSLLKLGEQFFPQRLSPLSRWLETLWTQAIATVPELSQWQKGQGIQLLLPGRTWCSAQAFLNLHFVPLTMHYGLCEPTADCFAAPASVSLQPEIGTLDPQVWSVTGGSFSEVIFEAESKRLLTSIQPPALDTELSFIKENWLREAIAATLSADIGIALDRRHQADRELNVLSIVDEVYQAVNPASLSSHAELLLLHSPLTLAEFCRQLQWLWVKAHQELMPLMSGITAYRLKSGGEWQLGTLVTTSQLVLHPETEILWYLELSTRQWHTDKLNPFDTTSNTDVIHLQTANLVPQSMWQMNELRTYLSHILCQRSPILQHLMTPKTVALTLPDREFPFTSSETQMPLELQLVPKFYPLEEA